MKQSSIMMRAEWIGTNAFGIPVVAIMPDGKLWRRSYFWWWKWVCEK